jgi:hypothetical protein
MKHKKLLFGFSFIFVLLLLFSGCKKEEEEVDTTPPAQVSDLVAVATDEVVVLTWTEPTDPDLDLIEVTYSPGSGVTLSQAAGVNGMTVSGLTNGTEYTFSVVTVDETGNKSQATDISAVPNTPFVAVDPDQDSYNPAGGTFSSDGNGHLIISVTFNRPLDLNSVKPAQTIYFEGDAISEGTVSFSNENKTVTFTTTDQVSAFGTYSGNVYFDFMLIGDDAGNGTITDSNGMVLDGDEDGESGGDYVLNLYIIG